MWFRCASSSLRLQPYKASNSIFSIKRGTDTILIHFRISIFIASQSRDIYIFLIQTVLSISFLSMHALRKSFQCLQYFFTLEMLGIIVIFDEFFLLLHFFLFFSFCTQKKLRYNWKDQVIAYISDAVFVLIFVFALIFHSHQTEATYRLDFIWKLQATGKKQNRWY